MSTACNFRLHLASGLRRAAALLSVKARPPGVCVDLPARGVWDCALEEKGNRVVGKRKCVYCNSLCRRGFKQFRPVFTVTLGSLHSVSRSP